MLSANSVKHLSLLFFGFILLTTEVFAAADGKAPSSGSGSGSSYHPFDYSIKVERKEKSRWTLKDWLEQKDRNHMMDLWLGMYAPSPYEFFISGGYTSYNSSTNQSAVSKSSYQSYSGALGAYGATP